MLPVLAPVFLPSVVFDPKGMSLIFGLRTIRAILFRTRQPMPNMSVRISIGAAI